MKPDNRVSPHADRMLLARPVFLPGTVFRTAVESRVDRYFGEQRLHRTGGRKLAVKAAILSVWLLASYVALVFAAATWWQALPAALSLAFAIAGFGFNVQHDGNHGAFSERPWINKAAGYGLDLVGGSSYFWHAKHNLAHHTYTNVAGADDDIDMGGLARLSLHDKRRSLHRYQQFYMWFLYGFLLLKWQLVDDFRVLLSARVAGRRTARPRGGDLFALILGKAVVLGLAWGLPLLSHRWPLVAAFYLGVVGLVGIIIGVVFQLAHCVEGAAFSSPAASDRRLPRDWATHQVESTVNFAPRSRWLTWYVGGLNYQIEHHLFPRVSHVHYPQLAPLVAATSAEHGVKYHCHPSFGAALRSHFRFLRQMGRPEPRPAS